MSGWSCPHTHASGLRGARSWRPARPVQPLVVEQTGKAPEAVESIMAVPTPLKMSELEQAPLFGVW